MPSLRSRYPHGFSVHEIDTFDMRGACEPRNVLRERTPLHALLQVVGDPIRHKFEWQLAAFMLAVKPDNMKTVARGDRLRVNQTWFERKQGAFEFGRCLTGCNLTEVAALRSRRASRVGLRQRGELFWMLTHDGERRFRRSTGLRVTRRIGLARGEQNMSRFVDVR